MTRLRTNVLSLLFVLFLLLAPQAYGVLGVGDIVFDPAALIEAVRQTAQMITTIEVLRQQYEHMIEMARGLPYALAERYGPIWTPWLPSWPLTDVYQLNHDWALAAHGSPEFEQGYRKATEELDHYGSELEKLGPIESDRLKRRYTGLELQDGTNIHALHTIGKVRLHSSQTDEKVSNLEADVFSSDPTLLTEMAQLQLLNSSNVIAVRTISDTNKLLTALVEQQLVESRSRREIEAQEMNRHIDYLRRAPQIQHTLTGTITNTLNSFRMP